MNLTIHLVSPFFAYSFDIWNEYKGKLKTSSTKMASWLQIWFYVWQTWVNSTWIYIKLLGNIMNFISNFLEIERAKSRPILYNLLPGVPIQAIHRIKSCAQSSDMAWDEQNLVITKKSKHSNSVFQYKWFSYNFWKHLV